MSIFGQLAHALESDTWHSTTRANQLPPDGVWSVWLMLAGRGFGKIRAAAESVRYSVESGNKASIASPTRRETCNSIETIRYKVSWLFDWSAIQAYAAKIDPNGLNLSPSLSKMVVTSEA
jgi:hypothetical protein